MFGFAKRFEIALRQIDPSVAIPYWDSTLDNGLPDARDSVMWTKELMGTTDASGALTGGDFANFKTFQVYFFKIPLAEIPPFGFVENRLTIVILDSGY